MDARTRRNFSILETEEIWRRWKDGESFSEVARALDRRSPNAVKYVLKKRGGFEPERRRRSARALAFSEREEISRAIAAKESARAVALRLGRSPSTISREIERNGGRSSYRAAKAEEAAWRRALRPKTCLLAERERLRGVVAVKLAAKWSPQQISGWLLRRYPKDVSMRVSHETIYKTLFVQAKGVLKKELTAHLRSGRTMRRRRGASAVEQRAGAIKDAVSIRQRPAEAEDRALVGHWEGDLLEGSRGTYVATLVERRSRFVMLFRVSGKETEGVVQALSEGVGRLPEEMMRTLTWDRGTEMAAHARFTLATDVKVYFCDPKSPWQRGTNENTNGLLRQYLPRGSDLSVHGQKELDQIALSLNSRPRKTLGYRTPADTLSATVALTG